MKARVVEKHFLAGGKPFPIDEFVMEEFGTLTIILCMARGYKTIKDGIPLK